jgi:hypothetical protein
MDLFALLYQPNLLSRVPNHEGPERLPDFRSRSVWRVSMRVLIWHSYCTSNPEGLDHVAIPKNPVSHRLL